MELLFINEKIDVILHGKTLFYPCSGSDCNEIFYYFANSINTFWFSDISYSSKESINGKIKLLKQNQLKLSGCGTKILPYTPLPKGVTNCKDIHPKLYVRKYKRCSNDSELQVNLRYGCAQFTLNHFKDSEIGVFIHRGDGMVSGEGSSNVMFLGNRKRRYEAVNNLWNKLYTKLADEALIISDGSNTAFKHLKKYHNKHDVTGEEIYNGIEDFEGHGLLWKCVGYASNKYGPTFVWKVKK